MIWVLKCIGGRKNYLVSWEKLGNLQQSVVNSILRVVLSNSNVEEALVEDMFKVQEESLSMLCKIEDHVMSSKVVRLVWATELKAIEDEMKRFEGSVLRVVQTGEIAGLKSEVKEITLSVEHVTLEMKQKTKVIEMMSSTVRDNTSAIGDTQETVGLLRSAMDQHSTAITNLEDKSGPPLAQLHEYPMLTPFFVGREEELDKLEEKLNSYGAAAIMQYGGIGKTQLAVAFIERAENKKLIPGGSFWIPMHGNKSQAVSTMANFAEAITGNRLQEKDREDINVVLRVIKGKLNSMKQKWLLVLDNADSSDVTSIVGELCRYAGGKGVNGWVLVTSRRGGETLWTGMRGEQQLKLRQLTLEQSMILLWRWKNNLLPSLVSDNQVREELESLKKNNELEYLALSGLAGNAKAYGLDGLPLAVAQAGSFVHKMRITFVRYVDLYNKKRKSFEVSRVFVALDERGLEHQHQRTVWTTWKLNVETLGDTARAVLSAFALFDASPVPENLVEALEPKFASDPLTYLEVVRGELMDEASLLQEYQSDDGQLSFGMHRMIRNFVQLENRKDEELYRGSCLRAVSSLHTCVGLVLESNGDSMSDPPYSCSASVAILLPHSSTVLLSSSKSGLLEKGFELVKEALLLSFFSTRALISQGRTVDASPLYNPQFEMLTSIYGASSNDYYVRSALSDMGSVARRNGNLDEAMEKYFELLRKLQQVHGPGVDHADVATTLHNIGVVAQDRGQLDDAKQCYGTSLDMRQRLYGEGADHPAVAESLHQMGMVAQLQGHLDDAEQWYRKSLDMMQRLHGEGVDHPGVGSSLHQMGIVAQLRGHLDDAEQWYRKSLDMKQRLHGEGADHPAVADSLHQMGMVAEERGRLDDAEQWYRKSLDMMQRLYGEGVDHPAVADSLHQMGMVAQLRGHLDDAEQWYRKSLDMMQRLHGEGVDHPAVADSLHQMGMVAQLRGRPRRCRTVVSQESGHDAASAW